MKILSTKVQNRIIPIKVRFGRLVSCSWRCVNLIALRTSKVGVLAIRKTWIESWQWLSEWMQPNAPPRANSSNTPASNPKPCTSSLPPISKRSICGGSNIKKSLGGCRSMSYRGIWRLWAVCRRGRTWMTSGISVILRGFWVVRSMWRPRSCLLLRLRTSNTHLYKPVSSSKWLMRAVKLKKTSMILPR